MMHDPQCVALQDCLLFFSCHWLLGALILNEHIMYSNEIQMVIPNFPIKHNSLCASLRVLTLSMNNKNE